MSSEIIELERKIIEGFKKASDNLIKTSADKNESLVITVNGEIKHVPAKELLRDINAAK
jgi:hypothetical protein